MDDNLKPSNAERRRQEVAEAEAIIDPKESGEVAGEHYGASARDQLTSDPTVPAKLHEGSANFESKGPVALARRLRGSHWPDL